MDFKDIANKIISLRNKDLEMRDKLIKNGELNGGYNREMEKVHNKNAQILNKIIETIGYPTIYKVGKEASEAAWLVIQHSIGKPTFMKNCLALLEKAVTEDKANPVNLAFLFDRIAVYEDRPQHYGTQFDWGGNGKLSPHPIDDIIKVNQRRKSLGLNTLEEQTIIIRKQAENENQFPPQNLEVRKKMFEDWRRKKGWIK